MIDTLQIATQGLAPGFQTFQCATLGHFFSVTITVSTGGSGLEVVDVIDSRRLVTIEVSLNGNRWKQSMWIETIVIDKVVQVLGFFKSATRNLINVVSSMVINKKEIKVSVR